MATFIEALGLLDYFSVIFPMILVFAVMYAILQKTKVLGDNMTTINIIIAIASAFMLILFPDLVELIKVMTPWFVVVFIFLALLLALYLMAGQSEESIAAYVRRDAGFNYIILAVGILIVLGSAGIVWGQKLIPITQEPGATPTEGGAPADQFQANILATFFNPQILGLIVLFVVAIFSIILLSGTPDGKGGGGGHGGGGAHH